MNKQSLIYGLIFIACILLSQEALAMHGFGYKTANTFRMSMKTLNYACLIALPHIITYQTQKIHPSPNVDPNLKKLTPESEKRILDTLYTGYPELKSHAINIVRTSHENFAAGWHSGIPYIYVARNCDDAELKLAQKFKNQNLQRFSQEENERRSKVEKLTIPQFMAEGERRGFAMTPTTHDLWAWKILHEGSHILHRDNTTINALTNISPFIALYTTEKIKQRLNIHILSTRPILGTLLKGAGYVPSFGLKVLLTYALLIYPYRYWCEYRADQDAIQRSQDPALLHAAATWFGNIRQSEFEHLPVLTKILHFYDYDVHPAHQRRAKYLKKAAEKLEEKQTTSAHQ